MIKILIKTTKKPNKSKIMSRKLACINNRYSNVKQIIPIYTMISPLGIF